MLDIKNVELIPFEFKSFEEFEAQARVGNVVWKSSVDDLSEIKFDHWIGACFDTDRARDFRVGASRYDDSWYVCLCPNDHIEWYLKCPIIPKIECLCTFSTLLNTGHECKEAA